MESILNFFGLCKKEELDNTKELLRLKDVETEGLLNQLDNLKKFEEIAKQYADFETKNNTDLISIWTTTKVLKTIDDVKNELRKEQLYGQLLEDIINDRQKIEIARQYLNSLLEICRHENKSHP